jgi:branched-chain amino acid transport system permease protein
MTRVFGSSSDAKRAAVVVVVLALLPLVIVEEGATYQQRLLITFLVFSLLAMAVNIVFGHTDQLFLFVGGLTGISTYTTILLSEALGVTPWIAIPAGMVVVAVIALIVSYVAARLGMSIIVLAILTLSLQLAAEEFFQGARDITGGTTGFSFTALEVPFIESALGIPDGFGNYYVLLVVLAGSLVLYSRMMNSKYGLAFDAIRQDEVAAESVGIDVIRYKLVAAFTGAALIGLVGPLYVNAEGWVTPSLFTFQSIDVLILIMLVLGGLRTMLGPIVGAAAIIIINEELQVFGQWRTAIYGLLLIVLFLYFRGGIVEKVAALTEFEVVETVRNRLSGG